MIEGRGLAGARAEEQAAWRELPLAEHMRRYLEKGLTEKEAMKRVAKDRGCSKRDIYALWKKG